MKYIIYCTCLLLACASCKQKIQKERPTPISEYIEDDTSAHFSVENAIIPADFNKTPDVSLSDYFESIELIPLETGDDFLIAQIDRLLYYKDRYYILDEKQHIVFVFDREGKFIYQIDKKGQGPGEYPFLDDIVVNPYTNRLELLCAMGFVYEYDLSGKHINTSIVTNNDLRAVHELIPVDEHTLVFHATYHTNKIVYYDRVKKEITSETYNKESEYVAAAHNSSNFYSYKNNWYFYRPQDRQVYKVTENELQTAHIYDFGKNNRDVEKIDILKGNPYTSYAELTRQISYWINTIGENNRYIITNIGKLKDDRYTDYINIVFDKKTQQSGLINKFPVMPVIVNNSYVISHCRPGELDIFFPVDMLDEKSRKVYDQLIASKEDDNPIIVKYKFKE